MAKNAPHAAPRFCSNCGTPLNDGASFCHMCGVALRGTAAGEKRAPEAARSSMLRLAVPGLAFLALVILTAVQFGRDVPPEAGGAGVPLGMGAGRAPDISSMSPQERADRLFNRVMQASTEGKTDSVAFFAPMAMGAIEALAPLTAHLRYDLGLVALAAGDTIVARAQSDTILAERPTHLLGLVLAARAADARGDATASSELRDRLRAAESAERARGLQEYTDHDPDIRAALSGRP